MISIQTYNNMYLQICTLGQMAFRLGKIISLKVYN